jgi:hypothetical protein
MFNSIGIIQRDAPTQGHTKEFQAAQAQMASDFVAAIREMKRIVNEELPGLYPDGDNGGELDLEAAKQALRERIAGVNARIQEMEEKRDQIQLLFDDIFNDTTQLRS